ncbi:GNAT family N-acetyltransferase [Shewanella schlegeliana]|uniref:GNAT family N-acetyltransferase n=1 Tax=Shewanella schlegeliana TaxID=190308 RepID=A0ABS1T581_9GAMM|nr:N-acetyltransferase [Shewanella schlegeliana]MBL4915304.1 GNAT family N-acetyltransferase [Shewanella schlegeliana]MCL1111185.1 GNAT family N-acetyltransferase [Shewanella schlegeliana]GIU34285.1 N-acetyltransferase GCN5 [Shewanella schlegeliana]
MSDSIQLSIATKQDLKAIDALEQQCFAGHCYPDFFFRQALDCWPDGFLVAKNADARVIGYLLASNSAKADVAWILSIAVSDSARGKGIGSKLISQLLATLPSEVNQINLTVAPDNPARALYLRCGFTEMGFEADYFGEGEPRLLMSYFKQEHC